MAARIRLIRSVSWRVGWVGLIGFACCARGGDLRPAQLRCEYLEAPSGIQVLRPALSWTLRAAGHDRRQTAYQVLVASSEKGLKQGHGDLWDSGRQLSDDSVHVPYGGRPLVSLQRCHWKVRVWDERGQRSAWSPPAVWEMGLLRPDDWRARWIGSGPEHEPLPASGFFRSREELVAADIRVEPDARSTLLRREFPVRRGLRRATVCATGLGYYELFCNGRRVGRQVLSPAKSNYRQWVLYDVHDVTALLRPGNNALGLQLGNGWFNPALKWWEPYRMQWFGSKRGLVQLHLFYEDGSTDILISDKTWKTAPGPVLSACIYDGEVYDAREEREGWDQAGFNDQDWSPAREVEAPGGELLGNPMPPIVVAQEIRPVALRQPVPDVWVYDLGQNFAGWVRFKVSGPPGTSIRLRYAEEVQSDGQLDPRSNERAQATDTVILRGEGTETYEPRFTFHGFRYVEVTGHPSRPHRGDLVGCVVHNACAQTGEFECDQELVNRIHHATLWSQRSAMLGYPLDCPQRDERLGWMGDAMVTAEESMLNFDFAPFLRHWLEGIRLNQDPVTGDLSIVSPRPYTSEEPDPTWSSACLVTGWDFYRFQGDRRFLREHYPAMRAYVEYLGTQTTGHILPKYWIGDWGTTVEGWQEGDPPSVATAFYYYDTCLLARAARVLGNAADAERYERLADEIRVAFNREFLHPDRREYVQGTQFSNAFPLFLGLVDSADEAIVLRHILDNLQRQRGHFDVGVLGTKYLVDALTQAGRSDVVWQLVNQRGFPSWADLIDGRTTLSEFWTLKGSHNHVMLGSIDAWFYQELGGIRLDELRPGFRRVIVRPYPAESLGWVRASVQSIHGRISVEWAREGDKMRFRVHIPANVQAQVELPAAPRDGVRCRPERSVQRRTEDRAVFELGSGEYRFVVVSPKRGPRR